MVVINLIYFVFYIYICIGYIVLGSWKSDGNQYTQLVKVLYCNSLTNGKQPPTFSQFRFSQVSNSISLVDGECLATTLPWPLCITHK